MSLTRDDILAVKLKQTRLEVPEWGITVFVRAMNVGERLAWEKEHATAPVETQRERLAAAALCDEDGARLFTADDAPLLAEKDFIGLSRIFVEAMKLNALSADATAALEKNSETTTPASTPSA